MMIDFIMLFAFPALAISMALIIFSIYRDCRSGGPAILQLELARTKRALAKVEKERDELRLKVINLKSDQPATPEEIHAACLAYNHSYGLLEFHQQQNMCREAVEWRNAWIKVGKAGKEGE